MELSLARDTRNDKKSFYRYVSWKRKVRQNAPNLMSKNGKLVTRGKENAEVLNNLFASFFTGNLYS